MLALSRHLLLAGSALCIAAAAPAWAQTPTAAASNARSFSIPAQPLRDALRQLMRQGDLQIGFEAADVNGKTSAAVTGSMSASDALSRLLGGTGLTFRFLTSGSVVIERAPQVADGTVQLSTLRIEGSGTSDGNALPGGTTGEWAGESDRPWQSPSSQVHLSQAQIQRFRGTSVGDIISGIPGVLTGENRNSGALDLNIRGMQGMNRVPVVIDGAQQSTVVYRGYSGDASRNYLDPDLLGEMVVEKGPSTRPEAVGATGGVMVARTIAVEDILQPGESFGIRLRGELRGNTTSPPPVGTKGGLQTGSMAPLANGGTNSNGWLRTCTSTATPPNPTVCNRYPVFTGPLPAAAYFQEDPPGERPHMLEPTDASGSVVIAKRWENFDIIGAYARRKAGNYFAGTNGPAGEIVSEFFDHRTNGLSRVYERLALTGDTRFRAGEQVINTAYDNTSYLLKATARWGNGHGLELGFNRFDSDFGDMMPSEIVRGEGFRQGESSNVLSDTWTARYRFQPDDNPLINLRANLWHKDIEIERNLYYGLLEWMAGWSSGAAVFLPAKAEYSQRTGFDIDNTSKLNGKWGDLTLRYGASYTWEDIRSDAYPDLPPDTYLLDITILKPDGRRDEWSAFLSAEYHPRDWLQIDAAIRYTGSKTLDRKMDQALWAQGWIDQSGFAPIFALTAKPFDGLQIYGRYAEAIRTPSLFESVAGFGQQGNVWGPNPGDLVLRPERMISREVGMNYDGRLFGGDQLRVHAAYFNNKVEDYLARAAFTGQDSNIEYAAYEGFEVRVEYDRGWIYGSVGGMYYLDMNFCNYQPEVPPRNYVRCDPNGLGGADIQIPPKESYSGTIGTRWLAERLDVGARVTHNGRRPDMTFVGSGRVNVRWTPSTIVDFYTRFDINDRYSVDFNIDNLTDRYYADPLLIGLTAAPGRTVRMGFTANF